MFKLAYQIDMIALGRNGIVNYRYVLSVMDVFSRFVWLLKPYRTYTTKVKFLLLRFYA